MVLVSRAVGEMEKQRRFEIWGKVDVCSEMR